MADRVFIQKSRLGLAIFELKNDVVVLSKTQFGKKERTEFLLKSVSAEYQRVARRFAILIAVPLVPSLFCLWLSYELLTRERMPVALIGWPVIFAFFFLIMTIRGIPRVDAFQFFDHWGKPIFYIVRETHQAPECDDFIQELLYRVDCIEKDQAIVADDPLDAGRAIQLSEVNSMAPLFSGEYRWKTSIVFGAFSAGIPWLGALFSLFEELPFPLVFIGTVVGIAFCVLSYQAKERFRHVSLIGAALSMVAPLFY
ncbi:MAG: hypothetical protein QM715_02435 [Nibricoccus sp.]